MIVGLSLFGVICSHTMRSAPEAPLNVVSLALRAYCSGGAIGLRSADFASKFILCTWLRARGIKGVKAFCTNVFALGPPLRALVISRLFLHAVQELSRSAVTDGFFIVWPAKFCIFRSPRDFGGTLSHAL